jgi:hypothetical protein
MNQPSGNPGAAAPNARDWLAVYAKDHPREAALVLAGVAAFAGVATVIGFGIDLESQIRPVLYLLLIGGLVIIVTAILNDKLIVSVLKWFILALFIIWVVAFALHRSIFRDSEALNCFVLFWAECRNLADQKADRTNPPPPVVTTPTAPPPMAKSHKVQFQFAGSLDRDDVRVVMRRLRDAGWLVENVDRGGRRTGDAAGKAEIRYRNDRDQQAAQDLAAALNATKLITKEIKPVRAEGLDPDTLEVWISR